MNRKKTLLVFWIGIMTLISVSAENEIKITINTSDKPDVNSKSNRMTLSGLVNGKEKCALATNAKFAQGQSYTFKMPFRGEPSDIGTLTIEASGSDAWKPDTYKFEFPDGKIWIFSGFSVLSSQQSDIMDDAQQKLTFFLTGPMAGKVKGENPFHKRIQPWEENIVGRMTKAEIAKSVNKSQESTGTQANNEVKPQPQNPIKSTSNLEMETKVNATPSNPTSGTITIYVGKLLDEFETNSISALEKYKDNTVEVRGVVQEIRKDTETNICVVMSSSDGKFMNCQFSNAMKEILMDAKKGTSLTVEGICDIEKFTQINQGIIVKKDRPFLKNCSIKATKNTQSKQKGERQTEILKSLVTIEGIIGSGTGFVAAYNGKKYIFTNTHVVLGNKKLKFKTIDGSFLKIKSILLSKDRDLLLLETDDNGSACLELETNLAAFQNGKSINVIGNSLGAGVNTFLSGNILGVGPESVEITASIVPGNSGSPIIADDNDKVIGVATLITIYYQDWTTIDTRFAEKRKFGVRIDNINDNNLKAYDTNTFEQLNKKFWNIRTTNLYAYEIYNMFGVITGYFTNRSANRQYPYLKPENFEFSSQMQELVKKWNSYEKKDVIPVEVMRKIIKQLSVTNITFTAEDFDSKYVGGKAQKELEINKKLIQLLNTKICELEYQETERKKRPAVVL